MADDIGGVWRTIGGRRVFIRTGTTLQQAMKESGKFKNLGKKVKKKKEEKVTEGDLSKTLYGAEADRRMSQREKDYEKHLKYVKDIMDGKTVIDDKYHEELDLETAKAWLKDDYIYKNSLSSFTPEEVDKKLAKDLPKIFGNKADQGNLANQIKNFDKRKVSNNKWSAEEQFLARMKSGYDDAVEREGKEAADRYLKNINVVAKSDDYLLYASKRDDGTIWSNIAKSYDKTSRISEPPDVYVDHNRDGEITRVEVNWASYGSMEPEKAEVFAKKLNNAIEFAKKVKSKKRL